MRDHDDVINSVFRRRDEYELQKKRKRRAATAAFSVAACLCLTLAAGFGIWRGVVLKNPHAAPDDVQVDRVEGPDPDARDSMNNLIKINEATEVQSYDRKMNIALLLEDKLELSKAEAAEYYGMDVCPDVPGDLEPWEGQDRFEIYKRDGGRGETYYDSFILNYSDVDNTRSINIEGAKSGYPQTCIADWYGDGFEASEISGERVYLFHDTQTGYFFAQFIHRDVGFRIIFERLSEDEIISVISSLVSR